MAGIVGCVEKNGANNGEKALAAQEESGNHRDKRDYAVFFTSVQVDGFSGWSLR
jgi:hypothetical protein